MSDLLVTPRGVSRGAAAAAALAAGFELAERVRPFVGPVVEGVSRAVGSLRDYSTVRYGPGTDQRSLERKERRERKKASREAKKKLQFENIETKLPSGKLESNMNDSVTFQRFKSTIGRKRRRSARQLFNADIGRMNEVILRWQSVSESLLGPGAQPLAYGFDSTVTPQNGFVCPVQFMSLTNNTFFPANVSFGAQRRGLYRLTYDNATQAFGYQFLTGQDNDGVYNTSEWTYEKGQIRPATATIMPRLFHKWTEIRLNLYGAAYYPLTYEILVCTGMPPDMSPFDFSPGGTPIFQGTNLNAFLRDNTKDYIGNPIIGSNMDRTDFRDKFRVLRRKIIRVEPLTYGDAVAQAGQAATGIDSSNIKNFNMFIRHDRFREYAWTPTGTDQDYQQPLDGVGFDRTDITAAANLTAYADVDREERVYLFIKCSAPRALGAEEFEIGPAAAPVAQLSQSEIPKWTGSYDIVVRNCFRYDSLA